MNTTVDMNTTIDMNTTVDMNTVLAMNEHRLKTSLSAAAGWADLLASEEIALDANTSRHAAERVSAIITRAIAAINRDIGTLRDSRHPGKGGLTSSDTGLLLPLSIQEFEARAGGGFDLDARQGLIVDCPAAIYRQIIDQLLENALNYSPPGCRIRVTTRHEDGMVVTSVIDEGYGIPDEINIFAPFLRAAPSGAPAGSGLGLHIVRTLATRYGGEVNAQRNPGGGSTFNVRLPAASQGISPP